MDSGADFSQPLNFNLMGINLMDINLMGINLIGIQMWFFNTSQFIARTHCGVGWTPLLINFNKISNFIIFLAYFSISITLFYLWLRRRREILTPYIIILFTNFILFCSFTHLCAVLAFTWPAYRFFTVIDFITAIISIITAIALPYAIVVILKTPSITRQIELVQRLQVEISRREIIEADCKKTNKVLALKIDELERQLEHKVWISNTQTIIVELKEMLSKGPYGNL